ncbi:hypothetical protein Dform_00960 [Dehalogenimonas formicexedens]|uniref:DUF1015 domain-containing protein n=1 Tax=Dehalogenimonas formicexedens TaxID=1839801 RepID=A0A1P8F753_9CHLR|nr:DUF1015 domain-containing protein [Dehalogenimonas formicexedens]APV44301.1 hypothetical protein Dform_00960 [Dehalogenimonas formicexedens]
MADIRPFKALRYNTATENMSAVICPPYDVISPQQEAALLANDPHNFIRIEYAKTIPGDDETCNRYTRALSHLQKWLRDEVLKQDDKPAYYLHEHTYTFGGEKVIRRGLFARVRLEEWDKMIVRPHERTMAGPKKDRIKLIGTLEADTSPVFGLYQDDGRFIGSVLDQVTAWPEAIEFAGEPGESHRLWVITDVEAVSAIQRAFTEKPIYIADGHHRYESSLAYRNERNNLDPKIPPDAAVNFVMMSLTDMADPGLLILPTHRVIKGLSKNLLYILPERLREHFNVETLKASNGGWENLKTLMAEDSSRFFIFGLSGDDILSLTVKNQPKVEGFMPSGHTATYRGMDVSVVDHVVLEDILGMNAMDEERVAYDHDMDSTISRVKSGEFQFAFILKPVKPETIQAISDAKDRMPRKSTYFYPKLPSGIVVYRLRD